MNDTILIAFIILQAILIILLSPLFVGTVRKVKARLQGRVGASIIQPYRDLRKLFAKDEVISVDASFIFRIVPYAIFAIILALASGLPIIFPVALNVMSDILVLLYLLAAGAFLIALAGMDTGSAFGGFGSSRELTFNVLAEGVLLFALLPFVLLFGTTFLGEVSLSAVTLSPLSYIPITLAFMAYLVALVTENARIPVDNPTTHLELTMVHEAMILEYSGKRLALMEWASWSKLFFFVLLAIHIFIPWGAPLDFTLRSLLLSASALLVKVALFAILLAFVESVIAKFRIFRVPDMLLSGFALGAIATLIITTI